MILTGDLIKELETYPPDWPVFIEVKGVRAEATDVDMESGGGNVCVLIHDYPVEKKTQRRVK